MDPLARTILLTTAALSGLLAAAHALRAAIKALDETAADVRGHDVTAQLLELTD